LKQSTVATGDSLGPSHKSHSRTNEAGSGLCERRE